jgi:PAS domain S-box-containing protein
MTRVLVVDDSELILAQVGDILVTLRYDIAGTASSGIEAVEQAKSLRPDIVLMDIVMPGQTDGIEAARQIRAEMDIPVVLLTGYEDEKTIDRIKEARADGYVMKPVRSLELKASIEIALQKKESEGRFRDLYREVVEKTSDLIYVVDEKGMIKYANDQIAKLVGYTKEDTIGKNFASFLTPKSLTYSAEVFRRHIKGEDIGPFELDLIDSAGNVHVIEMSERLIWEKGRVVEIHGIGRDVTERKRAEQELRKSEEKYRKIFNNAVEGIYQTTPEGKFISVNQAFARMLGYESPNEMMAIVTDISSQVYVNTADRKKMQDIIETNGFIEDFETEFRCKNGEKKWVSFSASVVKEEEGEQPRYEGILVDITEKKRAREEILYLKEFSESIINNMIDLIDIVDKDYTIIFQNKASEKKHGQGVGRKCFELYHRRKDPCDYCMAGASIREKTCASRDVLLEDGTYLEVHSSPIKMPDGSYCSLEIMRDITKRKRAEEALRESEERYRALYENNPSMYFTVDEQGLVLSVNPYGAEQLGYTVGEMIGQSVLQMFHEADRAEVTELIKACLCNPGRVTHWEFRKIRRDGSMLWVREAARAVKHDGGRPVVLVVCEDITERKLADEQLRKSEERYRILAENANDVIFTTDLDLHCTYISPSVNRIRGFTVEEAMAQSPAEILTPTSLEVLINAYQEIIGTDIRESSNPISPRTLELEQYCKDGSTIYTEIGFSDLRDANGKLTGVLGIGRDISERKRVEEALRKSEEKFRGVFETSRDFMYISSIDGKILDYNASARDFFGFTDGEIKVMSIMDIYADPEERQKLIEALRAEEFLHNYEIKLKKRDGSLIDALATIVVRRDVDGKIVGFQGTVKDITRMKQMERQLQQVEKLSGLGTMISGIAHELNNPLTAIMGNAELLSMNEDVTAREKKSLDVILQESSRAAKVVNNLLAFAREHKPERRTININDAIMESLKLREYILKVNNIDLKLSLSDTLLPTLADPHQLQQVFSNIVNNACDALAVTGGGTLTIRTEQNEKNLRVVFEDNGPGIDKENIKRLFDPFFTTKEVGKGTGLGLSIAYGIIEEHGGSIEVESEPGRGARFTVELPIIRKKGKESKEETAYAVRSFHGKSILVVDDEAPVRDFVSDLLSREGCTAQAASTAEDAISLMKDMSFDGVIADIRMPGMDGMEFYSYVLKNYPADSKKILFITGDTLSNEIQVFLRVSNAKAVAKPFTTDELLTALNEVFEG